MAEAKTEKEKALIFIYSEFLADETLQDIKKEKLNEYCCKQNIDVADTFIHTHLMSVNEILNTILKYHKEHKLNYVIITNFSQIAHRKEELVALDTLLSEYEICINSMAEGLVWDIAYDVGLEQINY